MSGGKKNRLFWRMFSAFMAILLVTTLVLSLLMVVMVRSERAQSLENELWLQARDVAKLMQQYDATAFWRSDSSLSTLNWKIGEIRDNYNADIWLVSRNYQLLVLGDNEVSQEQLSDTVLLDQINLVLSGTEIRFQGIVPDLGPHVVTIGVPWLSTAGRVGGAVLMHLSTQSLSVDYSDLIRSAIIAASAAIVLGLILSTIIAKRQSEPIRQIRMAVTDFAHGKLDRRVAVHADEELMQLADSFNSMAEELSGIEASRRMFVASVSHELRSPLTCIRGYVEGMLDGTIAPADREKYMNVVLSETNRLTKLVAELLDLSRIESGNMPMTLVPFDLLELIRLELIKFEGRIEEQHIQVSVNLPDGTVMVYSDIDRTRQVLTNLLDNAVKFCSPGGHIGVAVDARFDPVTICITNDGDPIDPTDLPHIFDRFYKADKAHTSGQGTGLGLSIVKKILDCLDARISVESDEGSTAFTFTIKKVPSEDRVFGGSAEKNYLEK